MQLSLGGGLPPSVLPKGWGEETHTSTPQMQINKMNTCAHAYTHPHTNILVLILRNSVKMRNTPSPELYKLMSFSATSQISHRMGSYK